MLGTSSDKKRRLFVIYSDNDRRIIRDVVKVYFSGNGITIFITKDGRLRSFHGNYNVDIQRGE